MEKLEHHQWWLKVSFDFLDFHVLLEAESWFMIYHNGKLFFGLLSLLRILPKTVFKQILQMV